MTAHDILVLDQARSLIRDMAHGYPIGELATSPQHICEAISTLLNERFSFEKGEVIPKIKLFQDTFLRRNHEGELFLVNHPEKGWSTNCVPIKSIEFLLANYNVAIGTWTSDKFSEYCPVYRKSNEDG